MNIKHSFLLLCILVLSIQCTSDNTDTTTDAVAEVNTVVSNEAQTEETQEVSVPSLVNWTAWEDWDEKRKKGDRPGLVWIHTVNCEKCIEIQEKIFNNPSLCNYINANFYAADLLDTYKKDIVTHDKTFKYVQRHFDVGYHELAYQLTKAYEYSNQLPVYPTIAFLDKEFNLIFPIMNMDALDEKQMEILLHYVGEGIYKNTKYSTYKEDFKGVF